jgi:hypothetical protein
LHIPAYVTRTFLRLKSSWALATMQVYSLAVTLGYQSGLEIPSLKVEHVQQL